MACAGVLLSGCSFDSSGLPAASTADLRMDTSAADVLVYSDVRPSDVAGNAEAAPTDMDTGPLDTAPRDAVPPDSLLPDALLPDTVPVTCDAKYGQAEQYVLCIETATSCEFFVKTYGSTCTDVCSSFGGTCLGGYDNSGDCTHVGQSNCNHSLKGQICICSK